MEEEYPQRTPAVHSHVHDRAESDTLTQRVVLTIFALGPCEPRIPRVRYPAVRPSVAAAAVVTPILGITMIATRVVLVTAAGHGISKISFPRVPRYSHAFAELAIMKNWPPSRLAHIFLHFSQPPAPGFAGSAYCSRSTPDLLRASHLRAIRSMDSSCVTESRSLISIHARSWDSALTP
jgi:hypothetical protein